MRLEFFGQSLKDKDSAWSSTSRLVNFRREPAEGQMILKAHLGTQRACVLNGAVVRAAAVVDGVPYIAHGGSLHSFDAEFVPTELTTLTDSENTTISGNNGDVAITASDDYFVWDGSTLTTPSTGAFSLVGSCCFFNQRTVVTEKDGRRVSWSDVTDASTFNGASFATTEARDDNIIRALPFAGSLWVFKERSIEQWADDGSALSVIPGAVTDIGLRSFNLITETPSGPFFVGSDGKVRFVGGGAISTPAVETSIEQENAVGCSYFRDEGHEFCVIHFSDRPAWVFDMRLQEWSERASGSNLGAWSVRLCFEAYDAFFGVDNFGNVLELVRVNEDWDGAMVREATAKTVRNAGEWFVVDLVEIECQVGTTEPGRDAQVMLETSKDRGHNFSDPKVRSLGEPGAYQQRVTYRNLGQFRQFTARLSCSSPLEVTFGSTAILETS